MSNPAVRVGASRTRVTRLWQIWALGIGDQGKRRVYVPKNQKAHVAIRIAVDFPWAHWRMAFVILLPRQF